MAINGFKVGNNAFKVGSQLFIVNDALPAFDVIYDLNVGSNASYANNDAVGTLYDSSGNNNHATQTTATNKPTYKTNEINSLPALQFDGSNDYMSLSFSVTAKTIFLVLKHPNVNSASNGSGGIISNTTGSAGNQSATYFVGNISASDFFLPQASLPNMFGDTGQKNRSWVGLTEVEPRFIFRSTSYRVIALLARNFDFSFNQLCRYLSDVYYNDAIIAYLAVSQKLWTDEQIKTHINTLKTQFAL